jgi:ribosomal protein S25
MNIGKERRMKYDNGKALGEFVPIAKDMAEKIGKMRLSERTQQVFWAILANTIGYESQNVNNESIRRTKTFLSPDYVSKQIKVPVSSVRRAFKELEARGVIKLSKKVRTSSNAAGDTVKRITTWVTLDTDVSKWGAKRPTHAQAGR